MHIYFHTHFICFVYSLRKMLGGKDNEEIDSTRNITLFISVMHPESAKVNIVLCLTR